MTIYLRPTSSFDTGNPIDFDDDCVPEEIFINNSLSDPVEGIKEVKKSLGSMNIINIIEYKNILPIIEEKGVLYIQDFSGIVSHAKLYALSLMGKNHVEVGQNHYYNKLIEQKPDFPNSKIKRAEYLAREDVQKIVNTYALTQIKKYHTVLDTQYKLKGPEYSKVLAWEICAARFVGIGSIVIKNCSLTTNAIKRFITAFECREMVTIDFSNNNIDEQGANLLFDYANRHLSVTKIDLTGNPVPLETVYRLLDVQSSKKKLPSKVHNSIPETPLETYQINPSLSASVYVNASMRCLVMGIVDKVTKQCSPRITPKKLSPQPSGMKRILSHSKSLLDLASTEKKITLENVKEELSHEDSDLRINKNLPRSDEWFSGTPKELPVDLYDASELGYDEFDEYRPDLTLTLSKPLSRQQSSSDPLPPKPELRIHAQHTSITPAARLVPGGIITGPGISHWRK